MGVHQCHHQFFHNGFVAHPAERIGGYLADAFVRIVQPFGDGRKCPRIAEFAERFQRGPTNLPILIIEQFD